MGILVVGSVALDSVKTPFGQVEEALGGSAVHFSAAASFFSKIQLVGVVGKDFPLSELDFLEKRGVDLSGLEVRDGKTFRWKGEYGFDLNTAKTLETHLNVFADFSPKVPPLLQEPAVLFLGNIHPRLQKKVLDQIRRPELVALDTMNFWIEGEPVALRETISKVDLVVINEGEARQLAKQDSLLRASRIIREWGPQTVVIKRGEYGALLFHAEEVFSAPGLPLESVKDPTGAGDSFAGGFLGYLASQKDLHFEAMKRAVIVGSAMASFNVEDFSCRRLRELSRAEISNRIAAFRKLSHFGEIRI